MLSSIENKLVELNDLCAKASGMPEFPSYNRQRNILIDQVKEFRPLTRWEFICRNGYIAWLDFVKNFELPEDYPIASEVAYATLQKGCLVPVEDTWDDPGDYPNSLASGPLPSYQYLDSIDGEIVIELLGKEEEIPFETTKLDHLEIEEMHGGVFDILSGEIPEGCSIDKWHLNVEQISEFKKILKFEVSDFEACDWSNERD